MSMGICKRLIGIKSGQNRNSVFSLAASLRASQSGERIHVEACDVFIFQKSVLAPAPIQPPIPFVPVVVSPEV